MERRSFLKGFGAAAACAVALPHVASAAEAKKTSGPNEMNFETAVAAITGGKAVNPSAKVKMEAPEIAENGAVVPVKVSVESPMSANDYVKAIHVLGFEKRQRPLCEHLFDSG
jgi:sulfur-oxidizing protein SoxY